MLAAQTTDPSTPSNTPRVLYVIQAIGPFKTLPRARTYLPLQFPSSFNLLNQT